MATGRTPEERFLEIIAQMQERINALEARPLQIPILDTDPSASYKGNIWAFQDGRIHIRLADGTIQELAGSSSSGLPPLRRSLLSRLSRRYRPLRGLPRGPRPTGKLVASLVETRRSSTTVTLVNRPTTDDSHP
jgi:hypothetical protein